MTDPFDTLGVAPRFDLDSDDLHRRMLTLTGEHHPDRFTDPFEQAEAAERAAQINEAYRTLADPERRANALLTRLGGPAKEDDHTLSPDLLMEVMEVREELETAVESNDADAIERLRRWAVTERAKRLDAVAALFDHGGEPVVLGKAVRLELNALRYFERMLEQMPDPA